MTAHHHSTTSTSLPDDLDIQRGQTQKNVNKTVLEGLVCRFDRNAPIKTLDLPCGDLEFIGYLKKLFPNAVLHGGDILDKPVPDDVHFYQMDLTKNFDQIKENDFDLVTSISGVMMFNNTLSFIENCVSKLKKNGTLIVTNDNCATIIDRIAYLMIGRYRIFPVVFEDSAVMTQIITIQELCRLLRTHGIEIQNIQYTSFYKKDLKYLPFALFVYPFQWLYLKTIKTALPKKLIGMMYPFSHLFCKHYIITGIKL